MPTITDSYKRRLATRDRTFSGPLQTVTNDQTSVSELSLSRTRTTDKQTLGWRSRIAKGECAATRLVGTVDSVKYDPGYAFRYLYDKSVDVPPLYGQSRWEVSGYLAGALTLPSSLDVNTKNVAMNEAKSRFLANAINEIHVLQGMVSLGELGETLRMLRNPAKSFRRRVDDYVRDARRNYRRTRGPPKVRQRALRDTWLEWSFGVQPTISDIKSAKDAILALRDTYMSPMVKGFSRKADLTTTEATGTGGLISPQVLSWEYQNRMESSYSVRYYGRVYIPVDANGKRLASATFGFAWEQFFPTVWELIPYSFLVDYFTNIGDIISAVSFCRSNIRWAVETVREELKRDCTGFRLKKMGLPTYQVRDELLRPPIISRSSKAVTRRIFTDSWVPDFQVQLPGFSLKWLNMAALAKSRSVL